jgi:filamentous hemagglutinin family protein
MGRRRDHITTPIGMRAALLAGTALCAATLTLPAVAQPAPNARPTGGVITAGSAAISRSTNNTQIDQSSQRAAINWQSFNVGNQQSVTFQQPSSSAVTLNRVTGPDPSQIAGRIDANGQVVIVNQSGVTFTKGAQVNTNGLMVSAAGISNQNFMAGNMKFDQPGNPNAKIVNQGTITVRQAGLAALVAPQVANSGVINAKLGHVVLAGAKTATLDLYGDGLVSLDVSNQVTATPSGATALVTNTGVIAADGGTVQLTARAADGIVQTLVQAGGKIHAATVGTHTGTVALNGVGGDIVVEGQLAAPGTAPGTKGGAVEIATTGNVTLASTARINASGRAGGGTVAIGTTLARARGGPTVKSTTTAKNVTIAAGATITADATRNGNGGRVAVLSTNATQMSGSISARGGTQSGDGGFVEVSGGTLALNGPIDVLAPNGTIGTILLDPDTLEIINAALGGGDQDTNLGTTGTILAGDPNTTNNQVSNGEIDSLLGSIVLQATNLLTVDPNTPITLQPNASLTLSTLSGNIMVGTGSPIVASGTGSIIMQAGTAGSGAALALNSDLTTGTSGGITLQSDAGIALNAATLTTGLLDVSTFTSGGVTQSSAGVIAAATLQSSAGIAGGMSLVGTANAIATLGSLAITGGALLLSDATNLTINGPVTASTDASISGAPTLSIAGSIGAGGTLALSAGAGGIAFATGANAAATIVDISTTGTVSEAAGAIINAGTLQSSGGITGNVSLLSSANTIAALGDLAVSGAFALLDASALNVGGTVAVGTAQLSLQDIAAGGISIISGGALQADLGTGMVSLRTDAISVAGSISAATIELAPNTAGLNVTLGAPGGLSLPSTSGLTTTLLRVGSVTASGGSISTTAGSILVGGTFTATGTLELDASGAVTQTAPLLGDIALTGTAASFALLNTANAIDSVAITATTGSVQLADAVVVTLGTTTATTNLYIAAPGETLAGTVTASGTLGLQTDSFTFSSGSLSAATIEIAPLTAGAAMTLGAAGGLSVPGLGFVSATTVRLGAITPPGKSLTTTAGTIVVGGTFGSSSTLELDSLGDISETAGALHAATLTGDAAGNVVLANANTIATLGSFTAGGMFALNDTSSLSIAGLLNAGVADLSGPSISEAAGGTISAAVLQSGSGVAGDATLGNANTIGTLAAFAATGSLSLQDITALSVSGSVSAGTTLALNAPGITFTGGAIVSGSVVDLTSSAGVSQLANATLTAATLQSSGGVTGDVSLAGTANAIANTGSFIVSGGSFSLSDSVTLSTLGALTASNGIALTAPSINIGGVVSDGGSGTTSLIATTGSIGETGTLIAGTLSGSAATNADLIATNQVGTLGNFTATSFTLNDKSALTLAGSIAVTTADLIVAGTIGETGTFSATTLAGSASSSAKLTGVNQIGTLGNFTAASLTLSDSTPLIVAGTLSAPAIALTAASITIPGVVTDGGSGATSLIATTGSIGETGTLTVGTLSGSAATTATLTGVNQVGTLANFTAASFTVSDTTPLAIAGTLSAPAIALTASSLNIGGVVTDGGSGTTSLIATAGSIGETGTLIAGTLSGSAATSAKLNAVNQVGTLGNFTAASFALNDTTPLIVAGMLSAPSIALTASSIGISGTITDGGTGSTSLVATTGTIDTTGSLIAGTLSGSSTGDASFTNVNVGTIASFTAANLTVIDASALAVTGPVSAAIVSFTAPTISGTGVISTPLLNANATGTISLTGGNTIAALGSITATSFTLNDKSALTLTGSIAVTTADLIVTGTIGETGTLSATTLTGSATTSATLTGVNQVGTLGNFTAASFTLSDTTPLTIAGTLSAPSLALSAPSINIGGVVTDGGSGTTSLIATTGSIGETGTLTAGILSGSAATTASLIATNQVGTLANFTAASFTLSDATPLAIAGTLSAPAIALTAPSINIGGVVTDGGSGTTSLIATTGSIGETGTLTAGTLSGSAATSANLIATNHVGTLGGFTATSFTLSDSTPLTVAGTLSAPSIALTAPSINIGGIVTDGGSGTTSLIATTGSIGETGALTAGTLSGSAVTNVNLIATNHVGTLGSFTAASFTLSDATPLATAGTLSAPSIALTAPSINISGVVTDGGNGTTSLIATTGSIGETGTLTAGTLSGSAATTAKLTGVNQLGTLANFTAANFTLNDATPLIVAGTLSAPAIALTAASITIPGVVTDGGAGTTSLIATSGSITAPGTLTVGTLSGSAPAAATFVSAAETVRTIAAFSAASFILHDAASLAITGPLSASSVSLTAPSISGTGAISTPLLNASATGTISLTGANTIAALGSITATSFTLNDKSALNLAGSIGVTTANLIVAGTIGETGTLSATTLTGSGIGAADFAGSNTIGTLGAFSVSSGSFTLADTTGLAVAGSGVAADNITITTPGNLTVTAGMFAPGTIALTANGVKVGSGGSMFGAAVIDVNGGSGGIALTGNGNIGSSGAGTVDLSTTGGITEAPTATFNAGLLQSSLGVTGNVSLPHAAVGAIGNFIVTGGSFSLTDSTALDVLGALTATNGIALTAPTIDNDGIISDGGSGTTSLIATTGSIGETGTLIAGTLSGSAATNVSLVATNQVGTLANFTAASFTLNDATPLAVAGTLSAPSIALNAPSLAITGVVSDGGAGTTSLVATAGTLNATGTLIVGTLSGSSTSTTNLIDASNKIATIASFTASSLTLVDASALAVTGPVSAPIVSLTAPSISGAGVISTPLLNAASTGTISLTGANTIAALGTITATSFTLNDKSALTLPGSIAVTTANLIVAGTIGETGTLSATTLSGSAVGAATFTGSNTIANLGSFVVTSGSLTLIDTAKLNVTGPVSASSTIYLASSNAGGITIASGGTLSAPLTTVQADAFSNSGAISATTFEQAPFHSGLPMTTPPSAGITATNVRFGAVTVPGSGLTTTAGSIVIGANFSIPTVSLELDSQGGITETTGALTVATLTGRTPGNVALGNANKIATLGSFTAGGTFTLNDASALSLAGTLNAPLADLSATAITEIAGGTIIATTLQSNSGVTGNVALGNTNSIGTLAAFTAGGTFALNDASALAINGPLHATVVDLTATAITEPTGATIIAGTLQSSGGVSGNVSLAGTANAIGKLSSFFVTGGDFDLTDSASLTTAGSGLAANNIAITTPGNLNVTAGMFAPGTIALTANGVTVGAGGSVFGAAVIDVNGGAGGIALTGNGNIGSSGFGTVDLSTTGGITEAPTATLNAGLLQSSLGVTGDVSLPHTAIGAIGNFIVTAGSFALTDSTAVDVLGALTATKSVALTAPTIDNDGLVSDGGSGTTSLIATTGSIGETGTLIAGMLSGSAATSVDLTGVNQVGKLGNFTAANFALDDATPLLVSGTLLAPTIALTATSIDIPGKVSDGGAGSTSLIATSGTIAETGTLIVGTLSGSTAGTASFANTSIGTIAGFAAVSLTLNDSSPLYIAGTLNATLVDLTAPGLTEIAGGTIIAGTLQSGGGITANAILANTNKIATLGSFTAGGTFALNDALSLTVNGPLHATVVDLSGAGITEPSSSTIIATALQSSGGVTGSASFLGSANAIVDVGNFSASSGFTLTNTDKITITGSLSAATVDLSAPGISETGTGALNAGLLQSSLGVTGDVSLPHTAIGAIGNFAVTGSIALTDSTGLNVAGALTATKSMAITGVGISETGSIATPLLTGSSTGAVDLAGSNTIATLGPFTATGQSFTLADNAALTVNGLSADVVSLTAPSISIPAALAGTTSINLVATSGGIAETGSITTPLLTGSATGTVSLTAANAIGTFGPFSAVGQSVTLLDASSLTINGLTADVVSLTAPSITIPGALTGTTSVNVVATSGSISATNVITTPLLTGSATGSADLSSTNSIAAIGNFSASGFTLSDNVSLSVNGSLVGGPSVTINLNNLQSIIVNGSITASAISLAAKSIDIPGFISDGGAGTVSLVAAGDGLSMITETGSIIAGTLTGGAPTADLTGTNQIAALGNFGGNLTLFDTTNLTVTGNVAGGNSVTIVDAGALTVAGAITTSSVTLTGASITIPGLVGIFDIASVTLHAVAGSITEPGRLNAAVLSGDATGSVDFTGSNLIVALGNFTSVGLTLNDSQGLAITGVVQGGPSIAFPNVQSVSGPGALIATTLTGSAAGPVSLTGPNQITTLSDFSAPSFALNNTTPLTIAGILNAGASAQLTAAGPITEPGTIIAGTLSGAATTATFTGTNQIAALGNFSATSLTLIDTQSLAVTGVTSANNVALTIPGDLTGNGALNVGTFTGNAAGNVALTGGNSIATLGSFTAGGSFVLNNASNMTIASTLSAPKIVITDAAQLTLGAGATITTGGSAKPAPNVTFLPNASSTPQGAFLSAASFLQLGSSTVTGISSANIVRINTSGAGKLTFDPSAGLNAPDTWLIVGVNQGQISGNVNVAALDITYGSVAGGSSLTGIVGGIGGPTAAGAVGIEPAANANYRFNSCVIHSVNCVLLPTATIPTANPLNSLDIGALSNSQDQEDLLLPVVSDQDY